MNIVPLDQISYENFAGLVNTDFHVWIDAQHSVPLKLSEITPRQVIATGGSKGVSYESFALLFLGSAEQVWPQQIYGLESAALGRFELFIVPIGRDANGTRYQAAFNRLIKPA
jgi:hypothetical protein